MTLGNRLSFCGVGLALLLFSAAIGAEKYVYVSIAGENKIAIYKMDSHQGKLEHQSDVAVAGSPGALAVGPRRQYLFAALRKPGQLASFRIDPLNGSLTKVGLVDVGADPAYLSTDRTGQFLLSAYYFAGKVGVHRLNSDGSIDSERVFWRTTAEKAHCILADSSNRFVFVPHTGPNAIFQFTFNETNGSLTPNSVPRATTGQGTGPRHLWFHPSKNIAYIDNEQGSSVSAYTLDERSGTLKVFQTITTLPKEFEANNSCSHVEASPSGRYLFVANRGHDSIAGYRIDAETGRLTALGQTPTEKTPRSFNIDPSGNYLYAAGQGSGNVAVYRINDKTGKLRRLHTYPMGKQPWWVQVVTMPKPRG